MISIGELAKRANVSNRTVRYYEELGLIVPRTRGSNRYRYYDDTHIERLQLIKMLQDSGFALKEILAALCPPLDPQGKITYTGQEMAKSIFKALENQRTQLASKAEEIKKTMIAVEKTLDDLRSCFGCTRSQSLDECLNCGTGPEEVLDIARKARAS
jgi:MerR family transcriptional regulator, Zn(II)-responsive regulator of zntA